MVDRVHSAHKGLSALESAAASAGAGFACLFANSDEYEKAIITARRAQGRYRTRRDWRPILLLGCLVALGGVLTIALQP